MRAFLKHDKRSKSRISNTLIFLLAFVAFLIVFGGICLWAVLLINQERQAADNIAPSLMAEEVSFREQDSQTLLIVTTDKNAAQGFIVVRTDPQKSRVRTLAIPRDTVVYHKTSEIRVYELFKQSGVTIARDALETLLGITIDNYAVISYDGIERLIDYFEYGVIMTLNENLNYNNEDIDIRIEGGRRTLSAAQAVDVLRYPAWIGGRKQRADIQAQMTAALINQYMRESRQSRADSDFTFMVNLVLRTDIRVSHYRHAKKGLDYLSSRNEAAKRNEGEGEICTVLSLEGSYQGSGDAIRYYTSDNIADILSSQF